MWMLHFSQTVRVLSGDTNLRIVVSASSTNTSARFEFKSCNEQQSCGNRTKTKMNTNIAHFKKKKKKKKKGRRT